MCNCKKLYAVTPDSDLYTVDTVTASAVLVGPLGRAGVTDIAAHKGAMYGITFNDLLLVDPNSGASAVVGPLGVFANALAVAPDGTIYGGALGDLVTINPNTGAATIIGPFGGGLASSGDLAFDSNGILYGTLTNGGTDFLVQIDTTTGNATPLFGLGFAGAFGLAFCCCGLFVATESGELFQVHVGTGVVEQIGKTGVKIWGISCGSCC
jgi:hypothetical protein